MGEKIADRVIQRSGRIPSAFIKTLTFDSEKAFAQQNNIANRLKAENYFTRPKTSRANGTVENRIWGMRRFFTQRTDLRKVSDQHTKTIKQYLNFRPNRKFDYLSPIQQTLKNRCFALIT